MKTSEWMGHGTDTDSNGQKTNAIIERLETAIHTSWRATGKPEATG
jgi:hypothetical protein